MTLPRIAAELFAATYGSVAAVAELGIGAAHDGPTPTAGSLSAALETAPTPETRARATAAASTIRTDGAAVAATPPLDAVSRERPPAHP